MNKRRTDELLFGHEGYRLKVYRDTSKGAHPTAGIGHKLSPEEKRRFPVGTVLVASIVADWYKADFQEALDHAKPLFVPDMGDAREAVLIDMAFCMEDRMYGFHDMIDAVKAGDWNRAAAEILDSKWKRDLDKQERGRDMVNRAEEDAQMMLTGEWPEWIS